MDSKHSEASDLKSDATLLNSIVELAKSDKIRGARSVAIGFSDSRTVHDPWALSHYLMYLGTFNDDFGKNRLLSPDDYDYFLFRFLREKNRPSTQKNRPKIRSISLNSPLTIIVDFLSSDLGNVFIVATFAQALWYARQQLQQNERHARESLQLQKYSVVREILDGPEDMEELAAAVPIVKMIVGDDHVSRGYAAYIYENKRQALLNAPIIRPKYISIEDRPRRDD